MSDSNEENISEILFDPKVSEILELLENGPEHESKICKHLSITIDDLTKRLEILVKNGIVIKSQTQYSVDSKKLAYIHAEGIAGGELKHGPLALIDSNVYAIVINPSDATYEDTLTSAREIKARGAHIIGVSDIQSDVYDSWIKIPKSPDHVYPITEIVPIQLLSYYSALSRGTDPDYPRNLAKSVTVR